MAEFRKWRVDFDANESGTVDKRRVPDPPGYEASAGREVVRVIELFQMFSRGKGSSWLAALPVSHRRALSRTVSSPLAAGTCCPLLHGI